jgi:cytochrome c oxidase subunit 1
MMLVTAFLTVFAIPCVTAALIMVFFDRNFLTNFFVSANGGDPLLYQHLFWLFGHPEVYILILPGMGIVSEILPVFARKPLFGYAVVVFSGIAIGFLGWGVWAHHMFATGMGPIADSFFTIVTMIIAIPTGVKIFNWIATMWGGQIRFTSAMLYATAAVAIFTVGGVSGIMHATSPHDLQQTDTYFVVAHFHYVLLGGLVLGVFSGLHYWFPKVTGRIMDERLGRIAFWIYIIGMNLTFMPMHWIGLLGMPRRIFTYSADLNLETLNMVASVGGFVTAIGVLVLFYNLVRSIRHGEPAGPNPWNAATLEWATESPPVEHNFNRIPVVHSREPLWLEAAGIEAAARGEPEPHIHMPPPSYWPLFTAVGVSMTFMMLMTGIWWAPLVGVAWTALGIHQWAYEPTH